jgi:hypothetical protein
MFDNAGHALVCPFRQYAELWLLAESQLHHYLLIWYIIPSDHPCRPCFVLRLKRHRWQTLHRLPERKNSYQVPPNIELPWNNFHLSRCEKGGHPMSFSTT